MMTRNHQEDIAVEFLRGLVVHKKTLFPIDSS